MVKHYLIKRGMLKCPTFIWKITVNRLAMANTASKPGVFGVGVGLGIGDGDGVNLVGVTINLSVSSCIFGSSSPSRR